jgi:hypothetical protein
VRNVFRAVTVLCSLVLCSLLSFGQATSGDIVGVMTDSSGAVVPNAAVTATNIATGVKAAATSNAAGEYRIPNLLPGHYSIEAQSNGLRGGIADVLVRLNQAVTANIVANAAAQATTVEVTADIAPIDTTTPQIQTTFDTKQAQDLPTAAVGLGVLNLSLLNAGVATSGGIGAGVGPSVSGQRPRNNNFTVEGVDNNSKSVTGPVVIVPNDAIANFTVLQNQFSPEFGHSSGGQFNETIKSGTNHFHGEVYEYFQNRNLNAIDASAARTQAGPNYINPRYDNNRFGGNFGGPIFRDKLFFFTNDEYNPIGQSTQNNVCAPTALGYSQIAALGGNAINSTSLAQYQKYAGTATVVGGPNCPGFTVKGAKGSNDFINAAGNTTGTYQQGEIDFAGPAFTNLFKTVNSVDFNLSQSDQFRFREIYVKNDTINTGANLPVFWTNLPVRNHIITGSEFHTFTPSLTNEFRVGYNRYSQFFTIGPQSWPGLDSFPNVQVQDEGSTNIGPFPNAPQFTIQNVYQAVDNISWIKGKHNLKFGIEGRKYISPQDFTQRSRGDYEWTYLSQYLLDTPPDFLGQRSTGHNIYPGDQSAIYVYGNDEYRINPHLTLDLGLRYEFTSVPAGEREQTLNSAASVPGLIVFSEPQPQYKNFAPRVGFAYSPGNSGNTSIRGGFGMAYDVLFDNLGLNTKPPQFGGTCDVLQSANGGNCHWSTTGFLAGGGLPPGAGSGLNTFATLAQQRALTSGYVPNQKLPYTETWNFGVQHSFAGKYTAEVRYVGTRGIHLDLQDQLNKRALVSPAAFLPTFTTQPTQAQLDALTNTLTSLRAPGNTIPAYAAAGFTGAVTSYQPLGWSVYHGLQTQLNRTFSNGLQFQGAWTWSHAEDNSTADVFSTQLTPRRSQDSQNVGADFGTSALDRRHRISLEVIYDVPFFKHSNWLAKNVIGNWEIAPVWQFQSPEYYTPQSATDSNLNGDSAPDRTIFNAAGVPGTGSKVTALKNTAGATVAYLAANPNAMYIQAGQGALATDTRNSLALPRTNNWDLTAVKRINVTESAAFEFQAQALNVFNHSQYVPGSVNQVNSIGYTNITNFVAVNSPTFNQPQLFFSNNARALQLAAKFIF